MTNKEKQIKNSFIYFLPIIASSILPFVSLPILTRILTMEDYGILALVQIYAMFANGLVNFGMTASYDRNFFKYNSNKKQSSQLLFSTLLFIILNFIPAVGLTFFFKGTLAKLIIGDTQYGNILFWAFCAQFFNGITYYYLAYFKNSEQAKSHTTYTIFVSFMNLLFSLFLVAYLRIGIIGLVYSQLFSGAILFAVLSYKITKTVPFSLNRNILFESLKISWPLTPTIFFGVIRTQFDKYMIGLLGTLGGVGIYNIAQKISLAIFSFMTALQNVFSPQVYSRMFDLKENGGRSIGTYLTPFLYISIAAALLVALLSEEIVFILTPAAYHGAINILPVLAMYYGFLFFGKITPLQLIYMKKSHICTVLSVVSITINIVLNIPFIMKWGAIGAAWATLISGLISGLISFIAAQKHYRINWEYNKIILIFIIFFTSAILTLLLREFNVYYPMRLAFKACSIGLYIYLGMKFSIISRDNFLMVKDVLSRKTSNDATT